MATPCSVDTCDSPARTKGLCQIHYGRLKRTGDPLSEPRRKRAPKWAPECSVEGCSQATYAKGWCIKHYENNRLRGGPLNDGPGQGRRPGGRKWDGHICGVDGCDRPVRFIGLCAMHCDRQYRLGDPGQADPLIAARGSGSTNRNGYREISVDGRRVLEHRYVMEQMLGRPLSGDENVHHRNGVRDDNRPENLELWVSCQPPRQNVEELVAWAHAVLDQYGDDVKQLRLFHT